MAKRSATARSGRATRRGSAAAGSAAAAAAPVASPAPTPYRASNDTAERADRARCLSNVDRALRQVMDARPAGNRHSALDLGYAVLMELCVLCILDRCSLDRALDAMGAQTKGLPKRNIARFVATVHKRYTTLVDQQALAAASMEPVEQADDLAAKVNIVISKLLAKLAARIDAIEAADLTDKAMHPMLRALEISVDASKVEADAEKKRAEIQRILAKFQAEQAASGARGSSGPAMSLERAMAEIVAVLGVPAPAEKGAAAS